VDDIRAANSDDAEGDFEYDAAHDMTGGPQVVEPGPRPSVQVEPQPDNGDGDYGYDLAHDMRSR